MALNVLIHGAGFVNKGAEAMLCTVRRELGRRLPEAAFWVLADERWSASARQVGCEPIRPHRSRAARLLCFAAGVAIDPGLARTALVSPRDVPVLRHLHRIDAVVDVSGYALGDPWGESTGQWRVNLTRYVRRNGGRSVYLPQAWGPFTHPGVARCALEVCRHADVLYARDVRSETMLRALPGIIGEKVALASDVAFRFEPEPPESGMALLAAAGIEVGRQPLIGVTPNMRIYERSHGEGRANSYVVLLAAVVEHAARRLGASVVLIPHEVGRQGEQDDRYLCSLLGGGAGSAVHVHAITGAPSAGALKSAIGKLDMLVGSRYHSIVASLSLRVPTIAVGWSHKYQEVMGDLGLAEYACDFSRTGEAGLLDLLQGAWDSREETRATLKRRMPDVERSTEAALDYAAEILSEGTR